MRCFYVVVAVITAVSIAGCDRTEAGDSAKSASGTTVIGSGGSEDTSARYARSVQPLVDELLRIESLIVNPATLDYPELDARVKEMNFAHTKVVGSVQGSDTQRQSFKAMLAAMDHTGKAHAVWKAQTEAMRRMDQRQPTPTRKYRSSEDAIRASNEATHTIDAIGRDLRIAMEAERLRTEALAKAVVEIAAMRQALADKN